MGMLRVRVRRKGRREDLLHEHFGNEQLVASAYMDMLSVIKKLPYKLRN